MSPELQNGPKRKRKFLGSFLKFASISGHVVLSLSQQFWAILRYNSYFELTSALANQAKMTSCHIEKNIFEENVSLNDCEFYLYG